MNTKPDLFSRAINTFGRYGMEYTSPPLKVCFWSLVVLARISNMAAECDTIHADFYTAIFSGAVRDAYKILSPRYREVLSMAWDEVVYGDLGIVRKE